ncbi:hypothetical protein X777_04299 [Ooceraea biroi]|uniref:THAP-type domain-containing protein n=1 Tax=Ooceraea biroi TaxID=2015173 RepID=A0A026WHY6_OOCBI|nr:hypothetical protein X777_04299 [Ooceraea biroi]
MDAINLSTTPNFKTTYICSDHFDEKSFNYSDKLRRRKQLRAKAVPENKNLNSSYSSRENVATESVTERVLVSSINKPENNTLKEKNWEQNTDCDKETEICGKQIPVSSLDKDSLNKQDCSLDKDSLNEQDYSYEPTNSNIRNDSSSKKR